MTGEKRYKDFVQSMEIYRWSNGCNFESEKKINNGLHYYRPSCPLAESTLQPHNKVLWGHALESNLVYLFEQRIGMGTLSRNEERIDFFGCRGTLKFLTVEQLPLNNIKWLPRLDKLFSAFSIPPRETSDGKVSDTCGFVGKADRIISYEYLKFDEILTFQVDCPQRTPNRIGSSPSARFA